MYVGGLFDDLKQIMLFSFYIRRNKVFVKNSKKFKNELFESGHQTNP